MSELESARIVRHRVLCASGVLGPPGESGVDEVLKYGPALPGDGIEFLVRNSHRGRLDDLLPPLQASGLRFPVVHLAKGVGARLPSPEARGELADNLAFSAALGAELGVLHLWDLPDSDRDFDARVAACGVAMELAADHGIILGIESVPCALASPLSNLRRLVEAYPQLALVLDTEFLEWHNELGEALDDEALWRSVRYLHIKDFDGAYLDGDGGRRYLAPGEGRIDFRAVSTALNRWEFGGTVTLECGPKQTASGPDHFRLNHALQILASNDWWFQIS